MGILSNTVSFCQYRVEGGPPGGDLLSWAGKRLAAKGFRSIEEGTEELSLGWVQLDDFNAADFAAPRVYERGRYLAFTLRRDRRSVPSILLKAHFARELENFRAANPGRRSIPREKRQNLLEAHRSRLLARTLPSPSTWDVVWDTRSGLVTFTALGTPVLMQFEELFHETFAGVQLVPLHPLARAEALLPEGSRPALYEVGGPPGQSLLDRIERNRWLGWDFLSWLLYRTAESPSEYAVSAVGPLPEGERFEAYVDERVVLLHGEEEGAQKVTVVGHQHDYREVRAALADGKKVSEANLVMKREELRWSATLRGGLFHLSSFKAPPVTIERDDTTDEQDEREAVFFERMLLLEQGLQMLHSIFAAFLKERLGRSWKGTEGKMRAWSGQ